MRATFKWKACAPTNDAHILSKFNKSIYQNVSNFQNFRGSHPILKATLLLPLMLKVAFHNVRHEPNVQPALMLHTAFKNLSSLTIPASSTFHNF